jgi:nucleoid-associated protein EbfC
MFGGLGNLAGLMKQAKSMQENMQKMQESLAQQRFEAEAGAGMVRAVVNGRSELVDIKIDPQAVSDVELLEDMIKAAMAAACTKAHDGVRAEVSKLTGGLNIPGLSDLLGGGA